MEPSEYQPFPAEVHDYVDGRLNAQAERDFERRMSASPRLSEQVAGLRRALAALQGLPTRQPADGFNDRVIGRIREEELAERARRRIAAAPVPTWQHAVQVGIGAVAASLVLAVFGLPGLLSPANEDISGTAGLSVAAPGDDDLLLLLGEKCERFETLCRAIGAGSLPEPDLQRQLVRIELEAADLARSQSWLVAAVSELRPDRRLAYAEFLDGLDKALRVIQDEIEDSARARRPMEMARVHGALRAVNVPDRSGAEFEVLRKEAAGVKSPVSEDAPLELRLYGAIRQADYSHDAHAVIAAAQEYTAHFPAGRLAHCAHAARVAALLRLGRDAEAARHYDEAFSRYDQDQTPALRATLRAYFSEPEKRRLEKALRALTRE